jgi:Spy/CpxP family protein refolding chaperone
MSTWKSALAVLLIFALGTVFGVVLATRMAPRKPGPDLPARELLGLRNREALERSLSLSPGQKQAIDRIIGDTRNDLTRARQEMRPRVRQIMLNARARIRAELTPEQQRRFDELIKENRKVLNKAFKQQE